MFRFKYLQAVCIAGTMVAGLVSCGKDEADSGYLSDRFRLDLATVHLASDSTAWLQTDNELTIPHSKLAGNTFNRQEGQRVVVNYSLSNTDAVTQVQSVSNVLTSPIRPARTDTLHSSPVKVQSVWHGGGYLNVILTFGYNGGKHTFRLYRSVADSRHLQLHHRAPTTAQGYPIRAYLSFPLAKTDSVVKVIFPTLSGKQHYEIRIK